MYTRWRIRSLRATIIEYIKTTNDDLLAHSFGDGAEVIDCWQWMLEISTHSERHIQQIREIKNDPNFQRVGNLKWAECRFTFVFELAVTPARHC